MASPFVQEKRIESVTRGTSLFSSGCRWLMRRLLHKRTGPDIDAAPAAPAVVGIKKSAMYRDATGEFRVIEFFLPADLLTKLRRPIEIQFLEGEELVTVEQFGEAINSRFFSGVSCLPDNTARRLG